THIETVLSGLRNGTGIGVNPGTASPPTLEVQQQIAIPASHVEHQDDWSWIHVEVRDPEVTQEVPADLLPRLSLPSDECVGVVGVIAAHRLVSGSRREVVQPTPRTGQDLAEPSGRIRMGEIEYRPAAAAAAVAAHVLPAWHQ